MTRINPTIQSERPVITIAFTKRAIIMDIIDSELDGQDNSNRREVREHTGLHPEVKTRMINSLTVLAGFGGYELRIFDMMGEGGKS